MAAIPAVPSTFPANSASVAEYKSCTKLAHNKGRAKQATFFAMFPLVKSIVFTTPPSINYFFAVGALGEASSSHRHVRHWHFHECPPEKHLNGCDASALRRPIRCKAQPRNAKAASASGIKAPRPFRHQGQGAQSVSAPRIQSAQVQNPQSKPPRENTELISFFAQAL